jgi:uncharacterized membrane protein YphA (DoxX/SURF4 family)
MRLRDSVALTLPSFILRVVLGVTFLWAGTGKLMGTMEVSGDDAARLANLGVDLDPIQSSQPDANQPGTNQPTNDPEPANPLPDAPVTTEPETPTTQSPDPAGDEANNTDQPADPAQDIQQQVEDIKKQIEQATQPQGTPKSDPPAATGSDTSKGNRVNQISSMTMPAYTLTPVQQVSGNRTASDYPEPLQCQRVYSIALMISKAADPGLTPDSQPITPTMPSKLASGPWPKILAWSAAITEIVAGAFLILGLLTRLSALGIFGVMLVAMWMTQIGPAALHSTDAILGFIPNNQPWYSPGSYSNLLWQVALASMSLAVMFLGSGAIGLDRLFFSPHPRDPYIHGDPKAPKKQQMNPASAQRSEFDRSPSS